MEYFRTSLVDPTLFHTSQYTIYGYSIRYLVSPGTCTYELPSEIAMIGKTRMIHLSVALRMVNGRTHQPEHNLTYMFH